VFYEAGEPLTDVKEGDFILVKHGDVFANAIEKGLTLEAILHHELKGFVWLDHTGFTRNDLTGVPWVSEMGPNGYERRSFAGYKDQLCARVRFDVSAEKIATACAYDEACEGIEYGWELYLPMILNGVDDGKFIGSWGDALVCSVHVTLLAMGIGLFPDRPAQAVDPARFAMWCGAKHG
jgi:hypothetical protein